MWGWLRNYLGEDFKAMDPAQLARVLTTDTCPACGAAKGFCEGHSGEPSSNMFCINCGQGYDFVRSDSGARATVIHRMKVWGIDVRGSVRK